MKHKFLTVCGLALLIAFVAVFQNCGATSGVGSTTNSVTLKGSTT